MSLRLIPKKNFLENYKHLVLKTLDIIAENLPTLTGSIERRIGEIENNPDSFREETLSVIQALSFHYKRISIQQNSSYIEAKTKRIFIPYNDAITKQKGVKDAGNFLVLINLKELYGTIPSLDALANVICIERTESKKPSHPHINSNKKPCWGKTRKELIKELMMKGRFLEILICIPDFLMKINFASSYNSNKADFFQLKEAKLKNDNQKKWKKENG